MKFKFKPRQGLSEMLELDAVKLAGQVDVLQTEKWSGKFGQYAK